jgi:Na+/melibiose symporter-like transporter
VFSGSIHRAKVALGHLVLKYVARASVAIPFVIALGFALAAVAVMLVERFGHVTGYWIMAGGLAAIGVVAAIVVSVKEHKEEVAEQKTEQTEAADITNEATQAIMQAPLALLGALMSVPGGATSVFKIARILARNFPLVLLLVMIAVLIWPTENAERARVAARR